MKWACLVVALFLAAPVSAQTVVLNPTRVQFQASTDHAATKLDGSAIVTSYELNAIGMAGAGALALTVNLGKPTPNGAGVVTVTVPQFSTLTAELKYTATVAAKGPDGVGVSVPSNPFGNTALRVPVAPGQPILLP